MQRKRKWRKKYQTSQYLKDALQQLRPPEDLSVSEWAQKYRIVSSKVSAIPGPWRNDSTPYLKEIMDEILNYYTEEIIFCKCTQVGGTEVVLNLLGYIIQQDPSPAMVVYPTDKLGESVAENRIVPMVKDSPSLEKLYNESGSQKLEHQFEGMYLTIAGSNSPSSLASKAIKYLFLDEVDKYPGASKKEADPVSLARERTKTFANRKIYITSTPTVRTGHIWKAKEGADAEKHYFIPCPHCGEFIELVFDNLKWPGKNKDLVEAYGEEAIKEKLGMLEPAEETEGLSNADRAELAFYVCQECGCVITDAQKKQAVKKGHWEVVRQATRFVRKVCFWINTLYSPFVRFSEIAKKFLDSKSDPDELQNFINSWLAEPWEDTKLKTDAGLVLKRQTELPEFVVPDWAKLLTGGVDVQQDCMYWTIRAWGDFITSQNIAHGQVYSFNDIENVMNLQYMTESGRAMVVNLCLVDSGFDTDNVYDFCAYNSDWALPCKGSSGSMESHFLIKTVNKDYSRAYGMNLVVLDGGRYKDMIAGRMHRANGRGSWMVYKGCDMEYAEQVTSEHKVNVKTGNGKTKQEWTPKHSHAQNHYLDCECYAMAAADTLGLRSLYLQRVPEKQEQKQEQYTPEEDWITQNENWI